MPWGVAAAAVVGLYSANKQSHAAKDAAKAQTNAANQANDTQWKMFEQSRADQQPFYNAGVTGLNQYLAMLGLPQQSQPSASGRPTVNTSGYLQGNPDMAGQPTPYTGIGMNPKLLGVNASPNYMMPTAQPQASATAPVPAMSQQDAFAAFRNQPGYQFGLDQGEKVVQAGAAARGGLNSGATLKALTQFGQNYADQQGYTPYMNRLAALAGIGQTSANVTGQQGLQTGAITGQNTIGAGQAQGQGIYDSTNAWTNFGNTLTGAIGQVGAKKGWF